MTTITINSRVENYGNLPYFFQNENVDNNKLFLCQEVSSLEYAVYVCHIWNTEHYNIGENKNLFPKIKNAYTLYIYNSNTDIKKYYIRGDNMKDIHKYKILRYLKKGKLKNIALLEYS